MTGKGSPRVAKRGPPRLDAAAASSYLPDMDGFARMFLPAGGRLLLRLPPQAH